MGKRGRRSQLTKSDPQNAEEPGEKDPSTTMSEPIMVSENSTGSKDENPTPPKPEEKETCTADKVPATPVAEGDEQKGNSDNSSAQKAKSTRMKNLDPPLSVEEIRAKYKWSFRISAVRPNDVSKSELLTYDKVQDGYFYVPKHNQDKGQLELFMENTNDAILTMIRILRFNFHHRIITVEVTKRDTTRGVERFQSGERFSDKELSGPNSESKGENAESMEKSDKTEEEENPVDTQDMNQGPTEAKEPGDETSAVPEQESEDSVKQNKEDSGLETKSPTFSTSASQPIPLEETATFMVHLEFAQKIKFQKRGKGLLSQRCASLGCLPMNVTTEMMKVIFPLANGIVFRGKRGPGGKMEKRTMFVETHHADNLEHFLTAYKKITVNGFSTQLSLNKADLEMIKPPRNRTESEKKDQNQKKTGQSENQLDDGKTDGQGMEGDTDKEMNGNLEEGKTLGLAHGDGEKEGVLADEAAENENATDKSSLEKDETNESGKKQGTFWKDLSGEEKKSRQEYFKQQKKRKREFLNEIRREWSDQKKIKTNPEVKPANLKVGTPLRGMNRRVTSVSSMNQQRVTPISRMNQQRGRGIAPMRGGMGFGRFASAPLVQFQMQDNISGLMQLQNQLETAIQTQMNQIKQSEIALKQAELRALAQEITQRASARGGSFGNAATGTGFAGSGAGTFSGSAGNNSGGMGKRKFRNAGTNKFGNSDNFSGSSGGNLGILGNFPGTGGSNFAGASGGSFGSTGGSNFGGTGGGSFGGTGGSNFGGTGRSNFGGTGGSNFGGTGGSNFGGTGGSNFGGTSGSNFGGTGGSNFGTTSGSNFGGSFGGAGANNFGKKRRRKNKKAGQDMDLSNQSGAGFSNFGNTNNSSTGNQGFANSSFGSTSGQGFGKAASPKGGNRSFGRTGVSRFDSGPSTSNINSSTNYSSNNASGSSNTNTGFDFGNSGGLGCSLGNNMASGYNFGGASNNYGTGTGSTSTLGNVSSANTYGQTLSGSNTSSYMYSGDVNMSASTYRRY